jgi:asparagine synthase (glutamine-hydrolysing)
MMILDSVTFLPDDILVKVDRASMSSGLEVRAPLLDYRIVEFASRLPLGAKIKGGKGKVLLRGALAKRLDQHLMNRPKAGFALPIGRWMKGPLRTWVDSVLDRNHIANTGILDPQEVDTLWKGFCRGENNNFLAIWHILMFQAWYQTYERKS